MLLGEYSHSLDSKNRLMMPSKLRELLGEDLVVCKNVDKCLSLYPREHWDAFYQKVISLPRIESRGVQRFLLPSAFHTTPDNQGRILLPPKLCQYADLTKDVTIIGVGDHLELWDTDKWNDLVAEQDGDEVAQKLIDLGF